MNWFYNEDNKAINPLTNAAFSLGDMHNGLHFRGYRKIRGQYRPSFFSSQESYEKYKLSKSRNINNSNIIGHIAKDLLHDCKKRARRNGSIVSLEFKKIVKVLKLGKCQGSWPPLDFVLDQPGSAFSPSLDRIDSNNKNYTHDNVRVVCKGINFARNNFSDADCLLVCQSLIGFIEKK